LSGTHARFSVGAYDPSLPLTIDPVIDLATYIGTELIDSILALETDASGAVYILGQTPFGNTLGPSSPAFAPSTGSILPTSILAVASSCFLGRLIPDGVSSYSLDYAVTLTFQDRCDAMAISPNAEVFLSRQSGNGVWIESFVGGGGVVSRTRTYQLVQCRKSRCWVQTRLATPMPWACARRSLLPGTSGLCLVVFSRIRCQDSAEIQIRAEVRTLKNC